MIMSTETETAITIVTIELSLFSLCSNTTVVSVIFTVVVDNITLVSVISDEVVDDISAVFVIFAVVVDNTTEVTFTFVVGIVVEGFIVILSF